jgi:SAM-dependent methyltransferase
MRSDYYRFLWRLGPLDFSRGMPYARCAEYPYVVRRLALTAEDRLLDIGSRYSPLPQILAHRYGCRVWAIDPEPDFRERQLRMARKVPWARALVERERLQFLVADAGALDFSDGAFTKIAAISVLEHIVDEGPVIRELARVLAPGGRLVISVPFDPWRDEPRYFRRKVYVEGQQPTEQFFMRYYSEQNLRDRLIEPSGLRLMEQSYFGEPGFNAHNLLFGNTRIPWPVRRLLFQPLAPWLASVFIRELRPAQFRHKTRMYTADTAVLVLAKP